MKRGLRFTADALSDLRSISHYLAREAGPRIAARQIRTLRARIDRLSAMPRTGVSYEGQGDAVRFVPSGSYLIYYEVQPGSVIVLRVLHAAQDRDSIIKGV